MSERIKITIGGLQLQAELADTPTALALAAALPCSADISTWGDEVYFPLALDCPLETDAREVVTAGELGYWPEGGFVAIGFGPTPISQGDEIRLAAAVNIWGRALDDVRQLKHARAGDPIHIDSITD